MENEGKNNQNSASQGRGSAPSFRVEAPQITLPKGGGAIRAIAEKFGLNPVTGTGSLTVPIFASPGRTGFQPVLALNYDSGSGTGPFGFGWSLAVDNIARKTDKGLPRYLDEEESDTFILSGSDDLVPLLVPAAGTWARHADTRSVNGQTYRIRRYRPRVESGFARIERWTNVSDPADCFWRTIDADNVTAWYGRSAESRTADPADPARIFSWHVCERYDSSGNAIVFRYKAEDSTGVDTAAPQERNRSDLNRSAKRYLKRVLYGNGAPYFPDLTQPAATSLPDDWRFELVFDYGDHDPANPLPDDAGAWPCRSDPYSTFRPCFEVRGYRLCRRALMFHHFDKEPGVGLDCLVRATNFNYAPQPADPGAPAYSYLAAVDQTSYRRDGAGGYFSVTLPPLEFEYSGADIDETVREADSQSLENLPGGLAGSDCRWVDLDGEGLQGILRETGDAWFYKPNLSPVNQRTENGDTLTLPRFGPISGAMFRPAQGHIEPSASTRLMDLSGDGMLDVVDFDPGLPGFFERTPDQAWESFRPFRSLPQLDWNDPNLRFIDLTGDGLVDILIAEDRVFHWHPSLGEDGYADRRTITQALDEEQGPKLVFSDSAETVFVADMSGDGLPDLVRVRNGEVCYWPNLGYGRFGARIVMNGSPRFDRPEMYDARRVQLADIDGSGTADIVYFGSSSVDLYFNLSGNGFAAARRLDHFPQVDSLSSTTVTDLLGSGTACLVWSSPLPANAARALRYIDLMAGGKPHLLTRVRNNMGAETVIRYAPSTRFYLADKLAGTPWLTRLPFPVHVVEQVETYDYVSRNLFVSRYSYHHGYYDGAEREFRGFGRVDQQDTAQFGTFNAIAGFPAPVNLDAASHVPPTLTKSWFHTGAFFGERRISKLLEQEYYGEGDASEGFAGLSDEQREAMLLPDTILPSSVYLPDGTRQPFDLDPEEMREAARALRGALLRQEVYGLDGGDAEDRPYQAREQNFTIEMLQPRGENPYGIFVVHPRESISFTYDRKLYKVSGGAIAAPDAPAPARSAADPRVTHTFTLAVDPFGNVLRQASVCYGRRYRDPDLAAADQQSQSQLMAGCSFASYTNAIDLDDNWRTPAAAEASTWQLLQLAPAAAAPDVTNLFAFDELAAIVTAAADDAHDLPYEAANPAGLAPGQAYRRLLGLTRQYYRPDDLGAAAGDSRQLLPLGQIGPTGHHGAAYRLVTTDAILAKVYKRGAAALLPAPAGILTSTAGDGGGYVDLDHDGRYWLPSGRSYYMAAPPDPAAELAAAKAGFFLPRRFEDAFGQPATIDYDTWNLMVAGRQDAKGNTTTALHDYRVLAPAEITDANGNRAAVAFDTLGLPVATALMGKTSEQLGDTLTGFALDLAQADIDALHDAADPSTLAPALLGQATTRVVYDIDRYRRTRLAAPDDPGQWLPSNTVVLAREIHEADLAAVDTSPIRIAFSYSDGFGRVVQQKAQAEPGPVVEGGPVVAPRWVGSGWSVFNNKGEAIRSYEPFFSQLAKGHQFEFATAVGVSAILCYDPAGRVVARIHPDHSYEKSIFDPWRTASWDVNDTALMADPATDPDVGAYFSRLPAADYLPSWKTRRDSGALGPDAQAAAAKTAAHADTPTLGYYDAAGRNFLVVADNGAAGKYSSHSVFDFGGELLAVVDPLGRTVAGFDYDMAGTRLRQRGMDDGERWLLQDAAGNAIRSWDSLGHNLRAAFDELRRPIAHYVLGTDAASDPRTTAAEVMFEKTEYGEGQPDDQKLNLRGRIYRRSDGAGIVLSVHTDPESGALAAFDFKGNTLGTSRQFVADYKALPDWAQPAPPLAPELYIATMRYDALNRVIAARAPDGTIARPAFDMAGLLQRFDVNIQGAAVATPFVGNIAYNAKAQRVAIDYGSAAASIATTTYSYDPETFRLAGLTTSRPGFPAAQRTVQALAYTYDPGGRITHVADAAQQTIFFNNAIAEPSTDYTYDALYRLVQASGREQLGLAAGKLSAAMPSSYNDAPRIGLAHPGDGNAMGTWRETYSHDGAGNLLKLVHVSSNSAHPGWTRTYDYDEGSLLEPGKTGNRLSATSVGGNVAWNEPYGYDGHGNAIQMPQLQALQWNFLGQLAMTQRQAVNADDADGAAHNAERTWYVYNAAGQRVRKVTESAAGVKVKERLYLGTLEIYREYSAAGATKLERQTLNVTDDRQRIALIETETGAASAIRFQFGNQLGSAVLELDQAGAIIAYEEYYPYGSTSYQAGRSKAETSLKRYRYTGKERDEESGLYYHGARYYACWLGRWISADPAGLGDGTNLYAYCRGDPVSGSDPSGTETEQATGVGITISGNGVSVGPISVAGTPGTGAPLAPLPGMPGAAMPGNDLQDLAHFLWMHARFKTGMPNGRTPQKVGQDAHADVTATLNDLKSAPAGEKLKDVDRLYSEVRVENGTVTQIGGKPGGPKGSLNPDLIGVKPGQTLSVGDSNIAPKVELTGDNKAGGGQIAQKYGVLGGQQLTINGKTNSADTDPALLQPTPRSGTVNLTPKDADLNAADGTVAPGPNTSAALARRNGTVPNAPAEPGGGAATNGSSPRPLITQPSPTSAGLGAVGRTLLPGVAELEATLMSLGWAAAGHAWTASLAAPLMTAAEALPVAAGAGAVGAGAGLGARALAKKLGASDSEANTIGFGTAIATGAALGSFIPGVGTAAGAVIGGLAAGALYLFSIW